MLPTLGGSLSNPDLGHKLSKHAFWAKTLGTLYSNYLGTCIVAGFVFLFLAGMLLDFCWKFRSLNLTFSMPSKGVDGSRLQTSNQSLLIALYVHKRNHVSGMGPPWAVPVRMYLFIALTQIRF